MTTDLPVGHDVLLNAMSGALDSLVSLLNVLCRHVNPQQLVDLRRAIASGEIELRLRLAEPGPSLALLLPGPTGAIEIVSFAMGWPASAAE